MPTLSRLFAALLACAVACSAITLSAVDHSQAQTLGQAGQAGLAAPALRLPPRFQLIACSPAQLNACAREMERCRTANGGNAAPCSKPMGQCVETCGLIPPNCRWLQDERRFACQ